MVPAQAGQPPTILKTAKKVQGLAGVRATINVISKENDSHVVSATVAVYGGQAAPKQVGAPMNVANGVGQHRPIGV